MIEVAVRCAAAPASTISWSCAPRPAASTSGLYATSPSASARRGLTAEPLYGFTSCPQAAGQGQEESTNDTESSSAVSLARITPPRLLPEQGRGEGLDGNRRAGFRVAGATAGATGRR